MKLAGKILVASVAALGMIGSGFAAWNYVSNGAAKVTQEVTPTTSGTVELQAELLEVTPSNKQLVLVPGSEQLGLSYNVKYKGSEFKGNEQLTVKVEANKDVSNYLSLPAEIEEAPSIWHNEENAATGYEVELEFAWVVGETEVTDLLAYAKQHYATTAAQQAFLAPYETAIEGVTFTITFDIEYGEQVEPVTPSASSIEAILVSDSIEVDGTSALMVNDDLDVDYEPSQYTIVEKSEGFDEVVSYDNGVFTGLAAGTASFKVQVGELKSEELTLTVTAKQSEEPVQENLDDFAKNISVSNQLGEGLTGTGVAYATSRYALKNSGQYLMLSLSQSEVPTSAQKVNITVTGICNGTTDDSTVTVDLVDANGDVINGFSQSFTPDKANASTAAAIDNAKTPKTVQINFNSAMRGVKVTLTVKGHAYAITNLAIAYE